MAEKWVRQGLNASVYLCNAIESSVPPILSTNQYLIIERNETPRQWALVCLLTRSLLIISGGNVSKPMEQHPATKRS